jgi:hypothetical protein
MVPDPAHPYFRDVHYPALSCRGVHYSIIPPRGRKESKGLRTREEIQRRVKKKGREGKRREQREKKRTKGKEENKGKRKERAKGK